MDINDLPKDQVFNRDMKVLPIDKINQQKEMLKDMKSIQKAEDQLHELQRELDKVKMEQSVSNSGDVIKSDDQNKRHTNRSHYHLIDPSGGNTSNSDYNRIYELEEELFQTREQLNRAETALANKSWAPPHQLQLWLQLTHELELNHYNTKRQAAETQLAAAKEGCDKLKKKRSTFFGSLRVAHGSSIDDVDNRILQAKKALSEITKEFKERSFRWQQIEGLCGFAIVHNRGIESIQAEIAHLNANIDDGFLVEMESEPLKSPVIAKFGFNPFERSFRSSHSSDHKSSLNTSSTSSSYHYQHHLQANQQNNNLTHNNSNNYLQAKLSRTEASNGVVSVNYHQESTDGSSESDLDAPSTPHQQFNQQQSLINQEKVTFTLGEGALDADASLADESHNQSPHRRTWSSMRRAPRQSRRKDKKTIEKSKSCSLNIVEGKPANETEGVDKDQLHGRKDNLSNQSRLSLKASPNKTSVNDFDAHNSSPDQSETTDEDRAISDQEKSKDEHKETVGRSASSTLLDRHSFSFYLKGARKPFNFMSQKRKKSSPSELTPEALQ
ncbi:stromal interaction molecule 1 isoform X2 [Tetranychus urticae]|uniref:stromal interaction molecule 1 isoform X2 n=1 Tax=Tetranychus urticae TaxID=32264 RepID=UPI00077BAC81|nr:stromal interaction molecule 1 isoform X2 [Tetranychus urticae]